MPLFRPRADSDQATGRALARTRRSWRGRLGGLLGGGVTPELWESLEEALIGADTGVRTSMEVLGRVRAAGPRDQAHLRELLASELVALLEGPAASAPGRLWGPGAEPPEPPAVVLVIGVNGSGKTTAIARLAHAYQQDGQSVIMAAGDTFRAAAIDQLREWGERLSVDVVAHRPGGDPAAVAFDTVEAARARGHDLVLVDTAGRLHNKKNLMAELAKIRRVIERQLGRGPDEVLLVLDATTGQNGPRAGARLHRGRRGHPPCCSRSSTGAPGAGSSSRSRASSACRCASSASARRRATSPPSTRRASSPPCWRSRHPPAHSGSRPGRRRSPEAGWMADALSWYAALALLGGASLLPAALLFRSLPSRGVLYTRALGLALLAYLAWLPGAVGIGYGAGAAWAALAALLSLSAYLAWRRPELWRAVWAKRRLLLQGELLFLLLYGALVLVRSRAPDVAGTEKPMDLRLLTAIDSAQVFPPADPWFAGEPISYYYLGHVAVDALAALAGVGVGPAFTLGVVTAGAVAGVATSGLALDLLGLRRRASRPGNAGGGPRWLAPAVAAAVSVIALLWLAPLAGAVEVAGANGVGRGLATALGVDGLPGPEGATGLVPDRFWWWWDATRLLPGVIAEFPAFSLLLGDLHAHLLALSRSALPHSRSQRGTSRGRRRSRLGAGSPTCPGSASRRRSTRRSS